MFSAAPINGYYHAILPLNPGFSYSSVSLDSVVGQIGSSTLPALSDFAARFWIGCVNVYTANAAFAGQFVGFIMTLS